MEQADRILIQRLASNGNADALADIMRQYAPLVYRAGWRLLQNDAQTADVVQETFFHLLKDARTIQGSLASWLHRVATRRAIDLIRQNTARRRREECYAAQSQPSGSEWREIEPLVDQVLDELPDDLRDILIRHFLEGQTMAQIAAAHGVSQPTISRRVAQGLDQLREGLRARGVVVGALAVASVLSNTAYAVPAPLLASLGKLALASAAWSSPTASVAGTIACGLGVKWAAAIAVGILVPVLWWTIHEGRPRSGLVASEEPPHPAPASDRAAADQHQQGTTDLQTWGPVIDPSAILPQPQPNQRAPSLSPAASAPQPGRFPRLAGAPPGGGPAGVPYQNANSFSVGGGVFVSGGSASGSIVFDGVGVSWTNTASGGFVMATNHWSGGLPAPRNRIQH